MTLRRYALGGVPHNLRIQSYAFVIVFDPADRQVVAYSSNLPAFLGVPITIGTGAASFLNAGQILSDRTLELSILNASRPYPSPIRLTADEPVKWGDRQVLSRPVADRILLVIEPRTYENASGVTDELQNHLLELTDELRAAGDLAQTLEVSCRRVALALDFDRVAVYQLEYEGGPGRISAEYNNGVLPSLLSLHFRSEDLPPEAYEKHRTVPVLSFARPGGDQPAMLGDYDEQTSAIAEELGCRSGFRVAERFLEENDLAAQLNIAIRIGGEFWGLVVAHSRSPRYLDRQHRQFARLIGIQLEWDIAAHTLSDNRRTNINTDATRALIRRQISQATDLQHGLTLEQPSLTEYLPGCSGVAIMVDEKLSLLGECPSPDLIAAIVDLAASSDDPDRLWYANNLQELLASPVTFERTAAGVLLAPLNKRSSEWIAWFRPEWVEKVIYGSRLTDGDDSDKRFVPTPGARHGLSLPWASDQLAAARDLQSFIREVVLERYGQLKRVNEQLRVAYDEMEAFSYTVSHDLRAPLRGIDGFAEILIEDFGDDLREEAIELTRSIQDNAARMNQFISDILELSRVGRAKLIVNDCDVNRLVREGLDVLEKQVGTKIDVSVQENLPTIGGDHEQLKIVFYHLLSNAAKYTTSESGRRIAVGYRPDRSGGGGEFYVSDNGIGIANQHHRRIFGMFNRLVAAPDYEGNGVGLAIARRILQRHDGEIRVESKPGSGTTFYFFTAPEDDRKFRT